MFIVLGGRLIRHGSRGVGTGVRITPSRMEKHKAVDYLKVTGWKSTKLPMAVIIGQLATLADQWWPVLVTGYRLSYS